MSESLTSFPKCKECGFIHPPSPPGMCPIAHASKQQESEQSKPKHTATRASPS